MDLPEPTIINLNKFSLHENSRKYKKYGPRADANGLDLYAAVFSTTGEMDVSIKNLLLEQIRLKLQLVDGEVKKSKVRKIMKHCVSHISAAINRSASRISSSMLPNWSTWHAIPNKTSPLPLPATLPPPLHLPLQISRSPQISR